MDETGSALPPPSGALSARHRRLLFRATHRGTHENDLLVGGFVQARLAALTADEMDALEAILDLPDPLLADWLTGRVPIPSSPHAVLLGRMAEAAPESCRVARRL